MAKKLYERDIYTIPDTDFLISKTINEYDIRSAGYNLIIYFKLLPKSMIEYLSGLSKSDRHVQIGIFERNDREFAKKLTKSFADIRKIFFDENNLDDDNIISIKKDAIFTIGRECQKTKFNNIEFIKKNKYSSFHKFDNIEMYYRSSKNILDIKGIRDELLYQHEMYFISFLKRVFKLIEFNDQKTFISFMKRFIMDYKNRNLDIRYYRELSPESLYVINEDIVGRSDYFKAGIENISYDMINNINISYNYKKYILPIMQRFYFRDIK